ncbi:DUF1569 domain-containing protein [Longimicrobium terrae]|uniref:DUF1569 domain-containing protein n=1 Tax=Longimicrobium terrae TaxID=1639882 RepID=A0A841GRH1_9BACT|nr:DUF1569 domain-containing protein [Longimicrobium terrae]MBB4634251.1 hypothetical protein [Longimicrobium terrae]MBB6068859.1 hypothetical protein [Longimicrobium terrae]NNC28039.1 DUF1569 domain-containing protein [Longimicrobium terrae]
MKHLYEPATAAEIRARLLNLRPDSARQWGTMSPGQAVAHCAAGVQMALGDTLPRRVLIGRLLGWIIKPLALGNEALMRRNSPTVPEMLVPGERDLDAERRRLAGLIDRFTENGPSGCTTHPHPFFGRLTPREWAVLMYKHLDHHLRQFGA